MDLRPALLCSYITSLITTWAKFPSGKHVRREPLFQAGIELSFLENDINSTIDRFQTTTRKRQPTNQPTVFTATDLIARLIVVLSDLKRFPDCACDTLLRLMQNIAVCVDRKLTGLWIERITEMTDFCRSLCRFFWILELYVFNREITGSQSKILKIIWVMI